MMEISWDSLGGSQGVSALWALGVSSSSLSLPSPPSAVYPFGGHQGPGHIFLVVLFMKQFYPYSLQLGSRV